MQDLIKANEIYNKIVKIEKRIKKAEKFVQSVFDNEPEGRISLSFGQEKAGNSPGWRFVTTSIEGEEWKSDDRPNGRIKLDLCKSSMIEVSCFLLRKLQTDKNNLVKQFNELNTKLTL